MKKNLAWLIFCLDLFGTSHLHAQLNCIYNNSFSGCSNNYTNSIGGCTTFYQDPCNGWTRSHGSPTIQAIVNSEDAILLRAFTNGSDGIYTPFQFIQGNNYDVVVYYNMSTGTTTTGSFNVYATSGVSEAAPPPNVINDCQGTPPTTSKEVLYTRSIGSNQSLSYAGDLQTFNQVSSPFSQILVYPSISTTSNNSGMGVQLSQVFVCVSCYAVTTYSSGTLPVQVNGKDITISIPAQTVPTLVEVTGAVYLQPGFHASSADNATFVAEISPTCTYIQAAAIHRSQDSAALNTISAIPPSGSQDSAAAGLLVYPTISKGAVTITGSPASLSNAEIVVLSETGQVLLRQYNAAATTLELNLGNMANGLYFIQIRQPAKVTTKKVIISH